MQKKMLLHPSILLLLSVVHVHGSASAYAVTAPAAASSTPDPSAQYADDAIFRTAMLDAHNFFRDEHNASALTWNDSCSAYSARWAEKCVFQHSGGPTGENLAAGYPNATAVVDAWANERAGFDFSSPAFGQSTGHFTQVVWKSTTDVGCGRQSCQGRDGDTPGYYVVCEYYPPGNVVGQFAANVQAQIKGPKDGTVEQGLGAAGSLRVSWTDMLTVFVGAAVVARALW